MKDTMQVILGVLFILLGIYTVITTICYAWGNSQLSFIEYLLTGLNYLIAFCASSIAIIGGGALVKAVG